MLRRAAKPLPPLRSGSPAAPDPWDARLWLGVHDLSRIEWTAAVQLPQRGSRRYSVELAIDIPSTMFPTHSVWEHLQIFTRLQSPAEEGPLEIDRHNLEELRRDTLGVAHRLKRIGQRFERAVTQAPPAEADAAIGETLSDLVTGAVDLLSEMRHQLARDESDAAVARECALSDEFLSHQIIDLYANVERALAAVDDKTVLWAEDLRCLVAEGLSEELVYRRSHGWVTPRADAPAELSQFLERASRLKKHFQDVLYLDVEAYFVDSRVRNLVGIFAAALAAMVWLSFTLLPIAPGTRAGLGIGTFACVFAFAYALKDRLKELARGWITGRLMRLYGQRVVTLRLPARIDPQKRQLLETHETFDVKDTPEDLTGDALGRPRRVVQLRFQMRADLNAAPALEAAHIFSIKHIFRYDLSPIFSRLDNALKQVPVLDGQRRVRFADAAREYRFPARISFCPVGGERIVHDANLVVSKQGIERIELRS